MNVATGQPAHGLRDASPPRPPCVAMAGAKGGVGKTLLAVNLAVLLARAGHRTLLVDLDPGCGDVDVHLRLSPRHSLEDAVLGACAPADALVAGPCGLAILCGRSGSAALAGARPRLLARALDCIGAAARAFDLVVCDIGAGIGDTVLAATARADLVLSVATPDPAAVTDAYALCKRLRQCGQPLPRLVVNAARSRDEAMRTAGRLASVCERFLGAGLPLLGWIRRDEAFARSVLAQEPLALRGGGPVLEDLRALAAAVLSALPALPRRPAPAAPRPVVLRPR